MPDINWNESAPPTTASAGLGAQEFQSLKTAIRTGLDSEHQWPTSGLGAGVHRLGSARPYYGPQSLVSSSGTDGRLMATSDTSRLFHVGSAGTMFVGGSAVLSAGSEPTGGQRFYWAQEWDEVFITTTPQTISFPHSGFSGVPVVIASGSTISATAFPWPQVTGRTATTFTVKSIDLNLGGTTSKYTLMYISIGTRTF